MEVFPIDLLVVLISARILRRTRLAEATKAVASS
jgi:hypothetical protein